MRFTITYGRKVRGRPYETMEISLTKDFDENTPVDVAFENVRRTVEKWIQVQQEKVGKA